MISQPDVATRPTLWGLTPRELHDRYWAALGVQVVQQGDTESEIARSAELFLLMEKSAMILFDLRPLLELFTMYKPSLLRLRVLDNTQPSYAESIVAASSGEFVRYNRDYGHHRCGQVLRVALTESRDVAGNWAVIKDAKQSWRTLKATVPRHLRIATRVQGSFLLENPSADAITIMRAILARWNRPDMTIDAISRWKEGWVHAGEKPPQTSKVIGRVWVGAGRLEGLTDPVIGPDMLWDDPAVCPDPVPLRWYKIEPKPGAIERGIQEQSAHASSQAKRLFDIVFAAAALIVLLPFLPLVALAILIEDGWPVFFVHRRESVGGREFGCVKFRTMRRNAERLKSEIQSSNQADGPQFYIENDPRITRMGRFLRQFQMDELPQFFNVLCGDMTVVGPRPSPYSENQYCPGWREARLSVRPGLTGLWQVRRTRAAGTDFQEWIRYDIEYVENASWKLDLQIIGQTALVLLRPFLRS